MKIYFPIILFWIIASQTLGQSKKVSQKKESNWVTPAIINENGAPFEGEESSYYYLLIDEQENIPNEEEYAHYAYKILTSDGVQEVSDLSIEFDPTYSELIFHKILIHRGKETINKLENNIRTIQREQSMDRFMYDGSLTAIVNLKDVRVGDIIEYSFTRKGYNPIYNGHFARKIYFNYQTGYENQYHKIITLKSTELLQKQFNTEIKPIIEEKDNQTIYNWTVGKTHAFLSDNNAPDWYDPWQSVSISDIQHWSDVNNWADGLFRISEEDKDYINKQILPSLKAVTDEDFILEAIHVVQDEIRYLGFEGGLNSHRPHPPKEVYSQRFGDCKDKSLLLVSLLRAKGIIAHPVLVHTSKGEILNAVLPSVYGFNHCVVELTFQGKKIYIDPTINNQGGKLLNYYFPNYRRGLVIDGKSDSIIEFPPLTDCSITEVQNFEVASIGGEAMLSSRTTYTGVEADMQRAEFQNNNLNELQKNYITFYSNLFPDITKFETIEGKDNRKDNIFNVTEKYKIPTFWKPHQTEEGIIYSEVYPQSLYNYFNVTKSTNRKAPYKLTYPLDYYHTIHIKLPEDWSIKPEDKVILTDYYLYEYTVTYHEREITIYTHYQTKKGFIPSNAYAKFVADHGKMLDQLNFSISYNKNIAENSKNFWPGALVIIISIIIGIWLFFKGYRYDPKPYFNNQPEPIGGWLILVAIGVSLTPIRLLYDIVSDLDTLLPNWYGMWVSKNFGLSILLIWESFFNVINLFFSILIAILFFNRRSSLPLLISIFYFEHTLILILDVVFVKLINSSTVIDASNYKPIFQGLVASLIWIPYFRMSIRVKETFVNTLNDYPENSEEQTFHSEESISEKGPTETT